ncbi:U32 family peptidase [Desulfuromonas sp. TF]|uniref:U32 family peptidase n=1 Tax=Desulfuromonas sp. TF TaxID=1232410 RepID=UPI00041A95ED|nr:U32 family peptidase [Desulfuromonas sp. TF]
MKILAPLKNSAETIPLLEAGADEFFCGLTPPDWEKCFGQTWANRRAPSSAGMPDVADFEVAVDSSAGRPVYVALNAPWYPPGAVEMLAEFGVLLLEKGASALIVADMDLLLALAEAGAASRLHVSSLATCNNPGSAAFFRDLGVSRVILPRHLALGEIEEISVPGLELETFLLNDGCVFEEGLCATTHAVGTFCLGDGEGTEGVNPETFERYAFWKWTLNHCGCQTSRGYPVGPCGLCALPRLLQIGIASFKVVGREASLPRKEKAVELAARALKIARDGGGPEEIRQAVVDLRGAAPMCEGAHLCYYPDVWHRPMRKEAAC